MDDNDFVLICHKELINNFTKTKMTIQEYADKKELAEYLNNGIILAATLSTALDEIDPNSTPQFYNNWQTDGYFVWFNMVSYYVYKYNLILPNFLIESIRERRYKHFPNLQKSFLQSPLGMKMTRAALDYESQHNM